MQGSIYIYKCNIKVPETVKVEIPSIYPSVARLPIPPALGGTGRFPLRSDINSWYLKKLSANGRRENALEPYILESRRCSSGETDGLVDLSDFRICSCCISVYYTEIRSKSYRIFLCEPTFFCAARTCFVLPLADEELCKIWRSCVTYRRLTQKQENQ
jgi:hypothetical protein